MEEKSQVKPNSDPVVNTNEPTKRSQSDFSYPTDQKTNATSESKQEQSVEPQEAVTEVQNSFPEQTASVNNDIEDEVDTKIDQAEQVMNTVSDSSSMLSQILAQGIQSNASDVHFTVGYRAMLRIDGTIQTLQTKIMDNNDVRTFVEELVKDRHDVNIDDIENFDFSYAFQNTRFRVNVFKTMGNYSIVLRLIPSEIKSIDQLGLPQVIKDIGAMANGLVLVTGPTGSGKSTTIASVLNMINLTRPTHIITLEDPVEYVFPKGTALIDQREFGIDFSTWPLALRSALRQDPDVVLVGEMRDFETIASTITLSETGHLVFATLHTNSAAQTIDRIIDVFPAEQQSQIRAQLANVLAAVISQRLVPLQGGGRGAALEIMLATSGIKNAIREGKTHQLDNMIQTGQEIGMITMEQSLVKMVQSGKITLDQAKAVSIKPDELDLLVGNQ